MTQPPNSENIKHAMLGGKGALNSKWNLKEADWPSAAPADRKIGKS
jgi:hypothetical protein